jgi:hypothetical protein
MTELTKIQPMNDSLKKTLLFLSEEKLNLPLFEKIVNFPKIVKEKKIFENKEVKFSTKKRGRKNKGSLINDINSVHTKFSNDNIKRRLKGFFNNYIVSFLNQLIKKTFKTNKIKFVKMNIQMTKDIGIKYNRDLLEKSIKDIIVNVSNKYQNQENNKICIKYIQSHKDNEEIMKFLNMKYKDLYTNYYLKSTDSENSFEAHKEKLLTLCGQDYLDKFIDISNNFIDFFMNGKNRKSRKKGDFEVNIPLENDNVEILSTSNEGSNENSEDNFFSKKNMVSCYTQTDMEGINLKLIAFG